MRSTKKYKQVVLPTKFHSIGYTELHGKLAHLGSECVLELARARFYWPKMKNDVEFFIQKKCGCISKRRKVPERAPLVPIVSTFPFEIVSIDYMNLDKAEGGYVYSLVPCDFYFICDIY